jgi:hypothetical protein
MKHIFKKYEFASQEVAETRIAALPSQNGFGQQNIVFWRVDFHHSYISIFNGIISGSLSGSYWWFLWSIGQGNILLHKEADK